MPKVTEEEALEIQDRIEDANSYMIGGDHYQQVDGEQHWDRVIRLYGLEHARAYFTGNITAYVERYHLKNGVSDLLKARHYLDKLIQEEIKSGNSNKVDTPVTFEKVGGNPPTTGCVGGNPTSSSSTTANEENVTHYCSVWENEQCITICEARNPKNPKFYVTARSLVTCKKCLEILEEKERDDSNKMIHYGYVWDNGQYAVICGARNLWNPKFYVTARSEVVMCKKCLEILKEKERDESNEVMHYNYQYDGQHYIASCGIENPKLSTHNQSVEHA